METIKATVKAVISPKDPGARKLMREYDAYKKALISRVQQTVRPIIKDRSIRVYAQQKWMVVKKLSEYLKNLPLHPMPFVNQSYWILKENGQFWIHIRTGEGETVCMLQVPDKYRDAIEKACGRSCPYKTPECPFPSCPFNTPKMCDKINPHLGEMQLIEDQKYGWINCHIVLRFPKPEPYTPKGWLGVDIGWNKLATTIACEKNPHIRFYNPTFHGKNYKTRIIQLRHLLKEYQRKGRKIKMWENRLQNTIEYAKGVVAKEIVSKAKRLKLGVAMEKLTFKPVSKGYLVPRYKLMIAVKTLCEIHGIPFKLVPAQYTSQTCPKCGYVNEKNRDGERFKCLKCGYQADADIVGAMNIAQKAFDSSSDEEENGAGLKPAPKADRGLPRKAGHVASPQASMRDVPIERDATHGVAEAR
jgi:predicted RNA-binding Zn-ribbon protein involved in translation (DUF1610 family)